MKITLSVFCILIFAFNIFGQSDECPKLQFKNSKLVSAENFNSSLKKEFSCVSRTLKGTIKGLVYADDTDTEPIAIIIQTADGRRHQISFPEDLNDCFSEADRRNWESRIIKGAKVAVTAFGCGAAGNGDLAISSIVFIATK